MNQEIKSSMNIENTQSQMRKGVLEFCILSIIKRAEAYPSDIIEEMKKANLHILEGTLVSALPIKALYFTKNLNLPGTNWQTRCIKLHRTDIV